MRLFGIFTTPRSLTRRKINARDGIQKMSSGLLQNPESGRPTRGLKPEAGSLLFLSLRDSFQTAGELIRTGSAGFLRARTSNAAQEADSLGSRLSFQQSRHRLRVAVARVLETKVVENAFLHPQKNPRGAYPFRIQHVFGHFFLPFNDGFHNNLLLSPGSGVQPRSGWLAGV